MGKGYLLGIDIGTYESKGVLTDLDGQPVNTQVVSHGLSFPKPGWAEHDAEKTWWGDFCSLSQRLVQESGVNSHDILGIGCSAIGPCMLPIDKQGNALRPAVLYGIDTRAIREIQHLENLLGKDSIYQSCGASLSAQSVGPKILWEKNNEPEVYEKAFRFVTSTTYLTGKLTGKYFVDHYTAASFLPLYDLNRGEWNKDFCKPIVERARLADLGWTTEIAGTVTKEAASLTGLAEGTPVIVGTVDAAAEAVSVGVVDPGQIMIMYGSTIFMIEILSERKTDHRLWSAPYLFPEMNCLMAGMATSGALTRWLRDNFANELVNQEAEKGINAYGVLADEASEVPPGSDGLLVLPYFSGERTPLNDPKARGVIFGLTLSHTRGHIFRAALEGIGHGIRHHFEVLREIDAEPETVIAVGGGTKNQLWLQIVSDICGVPQRVPEVTIGASYGDAFLAGLGVGVFSSYRDINNWLNKAGIVKPNPENGNLYTKHHSLYRRLYKQTRDIMYEV